MGTTYPRVYILDVHGKPVHEPDVECWAEWFSKNENRILRQTDIARNIWVSTVFLGVDHNYTRSGRGPPVLWETMIFGGRHDQYHQRYTSRADALEGHDAAVALTKAALRNRSRSRHLAKKKRNGNRRVCVLKTLKRPVSI
jgi:hypothetical protein